MNVLLVLCLLLSPRAILAGMATIFLFGGSILATIIELRKISRGAAVPQMVAKYLKMAKWGGEDILRERALFIAPTRHLYDRLLRA
jgi:hypothetical protein